MLPSAKATPSGSEKRKVQISPRVEMTQHTGVTDQARGQVAPTDSLTQERDGEPSQSERPSVIERLRLLSR